MAGEKEEDLPNNDDIIVRVGLDYSEEVHWSKILGEWSNMIGCKMGSSLH